MKHALERTSPFGQPFIGYCIQCEATNLPSSAVFDDCLNTRGLTQNEVFKQAIEGPDKQ